MRKLLTISLLAVALAGLAAMSYSNLQAADKGMAKPKTVTLTGEVVDLACYLHAGERGPDHKACAVACSNNGVPLGLLDEKTHKLYVDLGRDVMNKDVPVLKGHEAERVTVTAMVYEKDGLPGMTIQTLEAAK
jgi:type 1 fimbria pilin